MKNIAILFFLLIISGCNNSTPKTPEISPGLSRDQLAPTLEQIAETGEYQSVLQDLTVGLENAGFMEQAVAVQNFQELSNPEAIKKLASKLADIVQK